MTLYDAIDKRFSCRSYATEPLGEAILADLCTYVQRLCGESDLRMVMVGPADGGARLKLSARMFTGGVSSYVALLGPDDNATRERLGYYGERLVLHATGLGLGTCWVAGTFDRSSVTVPLESGEVIHDVIPVGQLPAKQPLAQRTIRAGLRKRTKKPEALYRGPAPLAAAPAWVRTGIEAVIKGPSAVNQQPVVFVQSADSLCATLPHTKNEVAFTDLGIAKLHFELGAAEAGTTGRWKWGEGGSFVHS